MRPPRQLRTTSLGKIVIAFSIVIGVAATNTGNNLLYLVLGGLFGVIAASGLLSERVLRDLKVELGTTAVGVAGRALPVPLTLVAGPGRDSFLLDITLLTADGDIVGQARVQELLRGRRRSVAVPVIRQTRGLLTVVQVRIATRFPFQMYEKARLVPVRHECWFAPAPRPVANSPWAAATARDLEASQTGRADGEDFRGLRERRPTDPVSRVHWRRSAGIGEQVVKLFTGGSLPTVTVRLGRGPDEERFEQGLEEVAGIVEQLAHERRSVRLQAGSHSASAASQTPEGWMALRRLLAGVERDRLAEGPVWQVSSGSTA